MKNRLSEYSDIEVLIKSLLRFDKLTNLVKSIQLYYPGITIRIADDSPDSEERDRVADIISGIEGCHFYKLPHNVGASAGRNFLIGKTEKKYAVFCDDDFEFTKMTSLKKLKSVLEGDANCVIAAGVDVIDRRISYFHGDIRVDGDRMIRVKYGKEAPTVRVNNVRCVPCRLTCQFFMGNSLLFKKHDLLWDERLNIREHTWFFYNIPKSLHVYFVPGVSINHYPTTPAEREVVYNKYRRKPETLNKFRQVTGFTLDTECAYGDNEEFYDRLPTVVLKIGKVIGLDRLVRAIRGF